MCLYEVGAGIDHGNVHFPPISWDFWRSRLDNLLGLLEVDGIHVGIMALVRLVVRQPQAETMGNQPGEMVENQSKKYHSARP
jgi:hypothetical protein